MKINPNALSQMYKWLRKSPVDDMAIKAAKSNIDDLALKALDTVDDMPTSISFDDISDAYKNRIPADKPPITSSEFVQNYKAQMPSKSETRQLLDSFPELYANAPSELDFLNAPAPEYFESLKLDSTPDYDAMNIDSIAYGQDPNLIDSMMYPDGFKDPEAFAHYYDDLEQGVSTAPTLNVLGHSVSMPKYDRVSNFKHEDFGDRDLYDRTFIIDGRPYEYPLYDSNRYSGEMRFFNPQDALKAKILDKYTDAYNYKLESLPYDELPEFVDLRNKYGFHTAFNSDKYDPCSVVECISRTPY